ncbi:MAG: amidohydrolase [Clostridiales bacterium]|nr:amidohydrolase [Clostridiales bacterium]
MSILIKNANILDVEGNKVYISDIYIKNNVIEKIQENLEIDADEVIDANGKVVMPGLINTHSHLGMSIFRTYGENLELMKWLTEYIFPKEELLTDELVYNFTKLSLIEAIKTGTTCVADMYLREKQGLKAYLETKMRGAVGINFPNELNEGIMEELKENNDMIYPYFIPHAPYTTPEERYREYVELAKKYNAGIQTHLSETLDEVNIIKERYGKTSTQLLKDLGVLDVPVILAHGIYLTDEDIEILKDIKGGISHNPISNCKLASGICDVRKLLDNGITVGLGTDGASSTTTLDMFEEMRTCAYMQKIKYMKSDIITSFEILKMATINNAKILEKENEIGSIKEGKKADLIIVDINKPHTTPAIDIPSILVYSTNGNDVETTIINGNIIMKDRKLIGINENEVLEKCNYLTKEFYKD